MRIILIVVGAVLAAALVTLPLPPSPPTAPAAASAAGREVGDATTLRATVLRLHNRSRVRAGVVPLRQKARLREAAQRHAQHMVAAGFFGHTAPDGSGLVDRFVRSGYIRAGTAFAVGENLWQTEGPVTPQAAMRSWMRSPRHRANVLEPRFRDIGIAAVAGVPSGRAGRTYVVVFGVRP
jgi:uncharacterized protein YkwD